MAVVFAMLVVMAAGSASAQCTLGVYADAQGTVSTAAGFRADPVNPDPVHVYVVLFKESLVNAVSFRLVVPGLGVDIFSNTLDYPTLWGPSGDGLNVPGVGNNVGLGECAVGFAGAPVLVADYTFFLPNYAPPRMISVIANPDENPDFPVVSDCAGNLSTCEGTQSLLVEGPVATESKSFGSLKSLYNE
jgi:hypothetical protein